jgi:hypothetical protein
MKTNNPSLKQVDRVTIAKQEKMPTNFLHRDIDPLTFISSVIITVLFIARPIALRTISLAPFSYKKQM